LSTYTETWSGQTTGSNSTTHTNRYASETSISVENPALGEQDDRVLRLSTGDSGKHLQSLDAVDGDGTRADCEIVGRFQCANDDDNQAWLMGRASGSGGSETAYYCGIRTSGVFNIGRWDSGSFTNIADGSNVDADGPWREQFGDTFNFVPTDEWLYMRLRINGTGATVTLQARFWSQHQAEPTTWDVDTTDTSGSRITAAGWIGVARSIHTGNVYWDAMGVGTNGDTAPIPTSTTPIRVTAADGQVLYKPTLGPVRVTTVDAMVLYKITGPRAQSVVPIITTSYD
jgi:hypothetical protein